MEGLSLPVITAICLAVDKALKESPVNSRWIPLICQVLGGVLGIAGYFLMPEFHSGNVFVALLIGIGGGASATGVHQTGKQIVES
jgi:hypothetical protein